MQPVASGSLISEPGFPVPVDAELVFGSDYVRVEQAQSHARINVNAVLKNKADGSFLSYSYKGIVDVNPEFVAIFSGQPDAQTTDYGTAFTHVNFETGSNALKPLEHGLFVGSAHFVVTGEGSNKTFFVESKVSRVVK
ncbi:hypothetical protein BDV18DRAFT_157737 [Aspergillus unguis]